MAIYSQCFSCYLFYKLENGGCPHCLLARQKESNTAVLKVSGTHSAKPPVCCQKEARYVYNGPRVEYWFCGVCRTEVDQHKDDGYPEIRLSVLLEAAQVGHSMPYLPKWYYGRYLPPLYYAESNVASPRFYFYSLNEGKFTGVDRGNLPVSFTKEQLKKDLYTIHNVRNDK